MLRKAAGAWTCVGRLDLARPSLFTKPAKDGHTEMVDVAFELSFDVSGLELLLVTDALEIDPAATDLDVHADPPRGVRPHDPTAGIYLAKSTTTFTSVPPSLRDSLRGWQSAWWIYSPTHQILRSQLDPMLRFAGGTVHWTSAQLEWRLGSSDFGDMLERISVSSPTELRISGKYAVDGHWTVDHEATCTKKAGA